MTYIVERLEKFIKQKENKKVPYSHAGQAYRIAYREGLRDARREVVRAEAELQKRIWEAWEAEGVEPR